MDSQGFIGVHLCPSVAQIEFNAKGRSSRPGPVCSRIDVPYTSQIRIISSSVFSGSVVVGEYSWLKYPV